MLIDGDGLAALVVVEVHFRQSHENGLAVAHFKFCLDAAADDLFRRYAVNPLRPRTHELDAAAGDDVILETVRAQISEYFEHRLIDHVGIGLAAFRMPGGGDPVFRYLLEFHRGHARMRRHDDFKQGALAAGHRFLIVALEQ